MLVLSRKLEEEIVIDGEIVIKVIEIRGDKVRLGVTAPVAVGVWRRELLHRCDGVANQVQRTTPDSSAVQAPA